MIRPITRFCCIILLCTASLSASAAAPFTIAVIGDQQVPVSNTTFYPSFTAQTTWIAANAQTNKIRFVTQVGDVVEHGGNIAQWGRAEAAMAPLDSATNADGGTGVAWNVNYGNHEEDRSQAGTDPAGAWAHLYRQYFGSASGTHRYAGQPEFRGVSSNDLNTWHIIKSSSAVDAREYLMLNLEHDVPGHAPGSTPDPADVPAFDAIAWAQDIIDQHPGMPTIITTHVFEGTAFGPPNNPWSAGPGRNSQFQIFDKLVKDNPQIFMVHSGHTSQDSHQVKLNTASLPVLQMVTDYTKVLPNGGDGFMRLVELDEDAGEIRVKTFTPGVPQNPTPRYRTGANGEFTVSMNWATRFSLGGSGPLMGAPSTSAVTDDGATAACRLVNADADDVTLVWAYADQGTTDIASWTNASGGGSFAFGAASKNDVLSHALTGLDGDTPYAFRFFAMDSVDSDWSTSGAFITDLSGRPAPAGFSGAPGQTAGGTKVDLGWTDSYTSEIGFLLQRSPDPAFASYDEFSIDANETTFVDDTTDPTTSYFYRIAAVGGSGAGPFSANLPVTTGAAGAGPVAGLIGHWKFDDATGTTAVDSSIFGNDATTSGGNWIPGGAANGAYDQPRFTLADSSDLYVTGAVPVSISLWVKPNAAHGFTCLAGFEGAGNTGDIYAFKTDGADKLQFTPSAITTPDTLMNYSNSGADWVHVVGVHEPGVGSRIYIDGVEVTNGVAGSIPNRAEVTFTMGKYWNSVSYDFNGSLDDVQVYSEALSTANVAILFANPGTPLLGGSSSIILGTPSASVVTDEGATLDCQLLGDDADDVTLVWARVDQGETNIASWTNAFGGGSYAFGAASENDVLSHVLTGLPGDTAYSFRFFATNAADSDWSAAASFATGLGGSPAPADFSGVAGQRPNGTKVDLMWTDSYAHESGFLLRRSTDPAFASYEEFVVGADETTFTDDTTESNTSYFYRIAAVGGSGVGPFSANLAVATGAAGAGAGLVGHWKFDEASGTTAADSSGSGYDADQTVVAGSWTTGKAGGAYNTPRFSLDASESNSLNLEGGSVTVSVWVTDRTGGSFEGIVGFEGTGFTGDIFGFKMDSADNINWTTIGTAPQITGDTLENYAAATVDGWVHLVGVYDGTTGTSTVYVNGSSLGSVAKAGGIPDKTPPSTFNIGRYWNSTGYSFTGSIDDVQVYDTALMASDVSLLNGNPGSSLDEINSGDLFDDWIAAFSGLGEQTGFSDDPDGDRLANGLEAWFGTHPGQFDTGLSDLTSDGTTTTFEHPHNPNPPGDLTGFYQWSTNLADWFAGDGVDGPSGGPTVNISSSAVATTSTVTAIVSEAMRRIFLRVGVSKD